MTTVLVADDSAEMRAFVRGALGHDYPDVVEAEDGRQLFWQLMRSSFTPSGRAAEPMVIVADVCMPAYSGLDVLDAWHDDGPPPPVVVITSFPDDVTRARVDRLGAILLAKPFTRAKLRDAVGTCVRRVRERAAGAGRKAP